MLKSQYWTNSDLEQGQTLEKPEVVPFRLTHNMIEAFGAYGYNGELDKTYRH